MVKVNGIVVVFSFISILQFPLQKAYAKENVCGKWDYNWDGSFNKSHRGYNRNLILIRHGQFNKVGHTDSDRYLTELGQEQAAITGNYLKRLGVKFDKIVRSTMTRARETGKIISESFPELEIEDDPLLVEGFPIRPDPPASGRHSDLAVAVDHARIEAAFRKYFHRADPDQQKGDTFTPVICHSNVIRYLVCRALQIPPEAWLRISLGHASMTWISIGYQGRVTLRSLGEASHIPPEMQSR